MIIKVLVFAPNAFKALWDTLERAAGLLASHDLNNVLVLTHVRQTNLRKQGRVSYCPLQMGEARGKDGNEHDNWPIASA